MFCCSSSSSSSRTTNSFNNSPFLNFASLKAEPINPPTIKSPVNLNEVPPQISGSLITTPSCSLADPNSSDSNASKTAFPKRRVPCITTTASTIASTSAGPSAIFDIAFPFNTSRYIFLAYGVCVFPMLG